MLPAVQFERWRLHLAVDETLEQTFQYTQNVDSKHEYSSKIMYCKSNKKRHTLLNIGELHKKQRTTHKTHHVSKNMSFHNNLTSCN